MPNDKQEKTVKATKKTEKNEKVEKAVKTPKKVAEKIDSKDLSHYQALYRDKIREDLMKELKLANVP